MLRHSSSAEQGGKHLHAVTICNFLLEAFCAAIIGLYVRCSGQQSSILLISIGRFFSRIHHKTLSRRCNTAQTRDHQKPGHSTCACSSPKSSSAWLSQGDTPPIAAGAAQSSAACALQKTGKPHSAEMAMCCMSPPDSFFEHLMNTQACESAKSFATSSLQAQPAIS